MNFINPFKRPRLEQVNADTLELARLNIAEHKAAAEFHDAMITMYHKRIARLTEGVKQAEKCI